MIGFPDLNELYVCFGFKLSGAEPGLFSIGFGWMSGVYTVMYSAQHKYQKNVVLNQRIFCKSTIIQVYYMFRTLGFPVSDFMGCPYIIDIGYWSSSSCFVMHISHQLLMCVRYQPECISSNMLPAFLRDVGVALLPAPPSCMGCSRRSQSHRRATCGGC